MLHFRKDTEIEQTSAQIGLHVDHSRQLLHSVKQEISLLYGFLVLPVLTIRSESKTIKKGFTINVAHD